MSKLRVLRQHNFLQRYRFPTPTFTLGLRILQTIPNLIPIFIFQGLILPLTYLLITFLPPETTSSLTSILFAPPVLLLLSNIAIFWISLKYFPRNNKHSSVFPQAFESFNLGFWTLTATLGSLLFTFLPRIFLGVNQMYDQLDEYSLLINLILPLLSIVTLYSSTINPEFRRSNGTLGRSWLLAKIRISLSLGVASMAFLVIGNLLLSRFDLPALNSATVLVGCILIGAYSIYFVPLSAKTEVQEVRFFALFSLLASVVASVLFFGFRPVGLNGVLISTLGVSYLLMVTAAMISLRSKHPDSYISSRNRYFKKRKIQYE